MTKMQEHIVVYAKDEDELNARIAEQEPYGYVALGGVVVHGDNICVLMRLQDSIRANFQSIGSTFSMITNSEHIEMINRRTGKTMTFLGGYKITRNGELILSTSDTRKALIELWEFENEMDTRLKGDLS